MAENKAMVDEELGTVDVGDINKKDKVLKIEASSNTQVTQPSQSADSEVNSQIKSVSITPKPGSCKRSRSPGCEGISSSQKVAPPKFARSCVKCGAIRSSLKLEIANLKKTNLLEVKKLREQIKTLNQEKGELRYSVKFLQKMYSNLMSENEKLKLKNAELKKIIMC